MECWRAACRMDGRRCNGDLRVKWSTHYDAKMFRYSSRVLCFAFLGIGGSIALFTQVAALNHSRQLTQQTPSYPSLQVPAHSVPVPNTVSGELQKLIAAPGDPSWKVKPTSSAEWKALVAADAAAVTATLPELREKLGVKVEAMKIGGVNVFMVTPNVIPEENRNRLLVHVHGGGYVFGPGEAGTLEAIEMAGYGHFTVISVDYRMPPDFPFPAALDDAVAVWKVAVTMAKPENMAIFGSSAGGGLTLAMVLRAKQEHLPMPAAIAPGTPWSDLTKSGDSYFTNHMLDNVLVAYDGALEASALLYANGHDLKDPMISPIYGDMNGFPPTILTTGTRDLFLSNTVRVHRKLRQCGVESALHVYEGMSHAQFCIDPFAPESKEAFLEIANFFNTHLGK